MSDGRVRGPRRDAAENRERILGAARECLRADPEASIEEIAARAGLTRRTLYGHFPGRDELIVEVLTSGAARMAASLLPVRHTDPRVEIALFGATLWSEIDDVLVTARFAIRGPHRERVQAALEPARRRLRRTVRVGIDAGTLRADLPAEVTAQLIEGAALAVLDEVALGRIVRPAGRDLVIRAGLGAAGLGWREADELITTTSELTTGAPR